MAREYLTPAESKSWNPSWTAVVYQTGPDVQNPVYPVPDDAQPGAGGKSAAKGGKQAPQRATVVVDGKASANLSGHGTYAVRLVVRPGRARRCSSW